MRRPTISRHADVFHQWLAFSGLLLFVIVLIWRMGWLELLLAADRSYLSSLILGLFALATVHAGWRASALSRELRLASELRTRAAKGQLAIQQNTDDELEIDGRHWETSAAHEHLGLLYLKSVHDAQAALSQALLLERLENRVRSGHDSGWFVADMMLKLGLLGTVIGFIFMLGSVSGMSQFDISAMQQMLTTMSDGMRIALFTTLTGLLAGMLLGIQYQMLDRACDRLMGLVIETAEVYFPGLLPQAEQDHET